MTVLIQHWNAGSEWTGQAFPERRGGPAATRTSALDAAFAQCAATTDRAAFTELMGRHKQWLYRFVMRYVGSVEDARDITQNCFVTAWSARASYDPRWPFEVWLRRIALNKCHDFSRRRRAQRAVMAVLDPHSEEFEVVDPAPQLDRAAGIEWALQRLHAAIGRLPRSLGDPLVLTALEGLSQNEAADVLGLTVKAVELRVRRARQQLAHLLDPADLGELAESDV